MPGKDGRETRSWSRDLETVQMTAAKVLGCLRTTSIAALRVGWGIHPFGINMGVRKLLGQYSVKNVHRRRLTGTVDEDVCKKMTKEQGGIRWGSVIERVWKGTGGTEGEIISIGARGEHKTKVRGMIEIREEEALRWKVDEEECLRYKGR